MKNWEDRLYTIIGFISLIIVGWLVYMITPDYSVRGQGVMIGKTFGVALYSNRSCDLCSRYPEIKVLYMDNTGEWHKEWFPLEAVKPYNPMIIKP